MTDLKLPYVKWRNGRPIFDPNAKVRRLGFKTESLRHAGGAWFTFEEARAWVEARLAQIAEARETGKRAKPPQVTRSHSSVADLIGDWLTAITAAGELSPDSIRSYRMAANAILYLPETRDARTKRRERERAAELLGLEPEPRKMETFARSPVSGIGKIELYEFFRYLERKRGRHMAHAALAAFSAAYTWGGLDRRWKLGANPRHMLELERPAGRIVIYTDAELRALDKAATAICRPSIGDAIALGLFTAQRQRDRLLLKDDGLVDGRRHIRQSKTGRLVAIRDLPPLAARLEAARARVSAVKLAKGTRPDTVVVDEATGLPYVQDTYRHWFGEVRKRAIADGCKSLEGKRDQDLRDTAVTWLARAGCTLMEICAISGHSPQSVQTIVNHYLGSSAELGDTAMAKLGAWLKQEGIGV